MIRKNKTGAEPQQSQGPVNQTPVKQASTKSTLLRARDGVLTRDLLLRPSDFGLGKVPARLAPDATTSMVCGFCSTGCDLKIHLRDGQAINLSPNPKYPVNLCIPHPIMWQRICQNKHQPEIIAVDPRKTETAHSATMHLPLKPKSVLVLFYGIANLLIQNGWIDRAFIAQHTNGFDEFPRRVEQFPLSAAATDTAFMDQSKSLP